MKINEKLKINPNNSKLSKLASYNKLAITYKITDQE
jgi:hypothetical protein